MLTIDLVGIGAAGLAGLTPPARVAIVGADLLAGSARHLAMLPDDGRPRLVWGSPLADSISSLASHAGQRIAVLASGDPSWHGLARLIRALLPDVALTVVPNLSAFQLAAARMGWSLEDVTATSVHGRPVARLFRHLLPGARLLVLTGRPDDAIAIIGLATKLGIRIRAIEALCDLGGPSEQRMALDAAAPALLPAELVTLAIAVDATGPVLRPPGLPDALFEHDGQLTKQEVRAVTLSRLAPGEGQTLWDIGAGCGSIAIEWLLLQRAGSAFAVECQRERQALIRRNAEALGVEGLTLVPGRAPEALAELPAPDAIFLGGSVGEPGLAELCLERLSAGGRLVANTVTIRGEAALLGLRARVGGELSRLRVERAQAVGGLLAWRPMLPVTQLVIRR